MNSGLGSNRFATGMFVVVAVSTLAGLFVLAPVVQEDRQVRAVQLREQAAAIKYSR